MSLKPTRNLQWFRDRRDRMLPGELSTRLRTTLKRQLWLRRRHAHVAGYDGADYRGAAAPAPLPPAPLDPESARWRAASATITDSQAAVRLRSTARDLLDGHTDILGIRRTDLVRPNWDLRPVPELPPIFDHVAVGSDKAYWELSRGNILTQLAAATLLTSDLAYGELAAALLVDWCDHFAEPSGPMWDSGVELGIRMQSWTWVRRLGALPNNEVFSRGSVRRSITDHLEILVRFPSSHSSANNHRLVEAAGLLTGGCCFADLVNADLAKRARERGMAILGEELSLQVTPAGMHREQAVDYHCFVAEVAFFALLEAELFGLAAPTHAWSAIHRMTDALHAICDRNGAGPRFGDSDNSHVVQLDATLASPTKRALHLLGTVLGGPAQERRFEPDIRSTIVETVMHTYLSGRTDGGWIRSAQPLTDRVALAREGTVVVERNGPAGSPQVWLSLRSGPLGYLPIAAHAHADLNTIELRLDGEPLIVDPGSFLYGEDLALRRTFRETHTHSTVVVNGLSQARYAGPFLWSSDAVGTVDIESIVAWHEPDPGKLVPTGVEVGDFAATHDGFLRLANGPLHRRAVDLSNEELRITDTLIPGPDRTIEAPIDMELNFLLDGHWSTRLAGSTLTACRAEWTVAVDLDPTFTWSLHCDDPHGTGWQSPVYGHLTPATALRGRSAVGPLQPVLTVFAWRKVAAW